MHYGFISFSAQKNFYVGIAYYVYEVAETKGESVQGEGVSQVAYCCAEKRCGETGLE